MARLGKVSLFGFGQFCPIVEEKTMKTIALCLFLSASFFSFNASAAPSSKPVTRKAPAKRKGFKLHFNRKKSVPWKERLMRVWGLKAGLQGMAGTGGKDFPVAGGGFIGGYYCFKQGAVCLEAVFNMGAVPLYSYGPTVGMRWNPWTNRHWFGVGLHLSLENFPVGSSSSGFQWTVDLSPGILWRAFGDYASTAILLEIVVRAGAQHYSSYLYAPTTAHPVFWLALKVSLDWAMNQRHRDGRSLSQFTGRSNYDPARSRGIDQNLQQRRFPYHRRRSRSGHTMIYRGLKLPLFGDTDGDGTLNTVDKCPLHKGKAKYKGCPKDLDSDNDGIPDYLDRRPLVPKKGGAKLRGA